VKHLICFLLLVAGLFAQAPYGAPVNQSGGPPSDLWTVYPYVSGNTTYVCWSKPGTAVSSVVPVTAVTNANPAVFTLTGHGFHASSNPTVTVAGLTGTWAALNGKQAVTVIDANTFSINVNTTSFGAIGAQLATLAKMVTYAPRTHLSYWAVQKIVTDGTNTLAVMWSTDGYGAVCNNRASLNYQ
jgi:hypothetical protein